MNLPVELQRRLGPAMVRTFRDARTRFGPINSSSPMFQPQPMGRFAYRCGVRFDGAWHPAS